MAVSKAGTDTSPGLFVLRREGRTRPGSFTSPVQICRDGFSGSRSRASADPERTVEEVSPRRQWLCQRVRPPHALAGELVQEWSGVLDAAVSQCANRSNLDSRFCWRLS